MRSILNALMMISIAALSACGGAGGGGDDGGSGGSSSIDGGIYHGPDSIDLTGHHHGQVHIPPSGGTIPFSAFTIEQAGTFRTAVASDFRLEGCGISEDDPSLTLTSEALVFSDRTEHGMPNCAIRIGTNVIDVYQAMNSEDTNWDGYNLSWGAGDQRHFTGNAIVIRKGARLKLSNINHGLVSGLSSNELGFSWQLGEQYPAFDTAGQGELSVTFMNGVSGTVSITVIDSIESVQLNAGYEASGHDNPIAFKGHVSPIELEVVSSSELDLSSTSLSALYDIDFQNDSVSLRQTGNGFFVHEGIQESQVTITARPKQDLFEFLGIDTQELSIDLDIVEMERMSLDQTYYSLAIGDSLEFKLTGQYGGQSYDLSRSFDGNRDGGYPLINNQTSIAEQKGLLETQTFWARVAGTNTLIARYYIEVGDPAPDSLKGLWQNLETGEPRIISDYIAEAYEETAGNLIKDSAGNHFVRASIPDVAVTAEVRSIGVPADAAKPSVVAKRSNVFASTSFKSVDTGAVSTNKAARQPMVSIGGGNVIFRNVNTGDTESVNPQNGAIETNLPTGTYIASQTIEYPDEEGDGGVSYAVFETPVVIEGEAVDLGTFTAVNSELYNFKASLVSKELVYFGTDDNEPVRSYSENLYITNIGRATVGGLSFVISSDDAEFRALDYQQALASLAPGESRVIPITFSLIKPQQEKQLRINVQMRDDRGRTWNDYTVLTLSAQEPVEFEVYGRNGEQNGSVNGYIVTPGRKLVRLAIENSYQAAGYTLPYTPDESYQMIMTSTSTENTSAYSIGIDAKVNLNDLVNFIDTGKNEDFSGTGDNVPSGANQLSLGDTYIGYVGVNDIDYFDIHMTGLKEWNKESKIFDLADKTHSNNFSKLRVSGDKVILTIGSDLYVADIAGDGVLLSDALVAGRMAVEGDLLYVVTSQTIRAYDVANIGSVTLLASYDASAEFSDIREIAVNEGILYLSYRYSADSKEARVTSYSLNQARDAISALSTITLDSAPSYCSGNNLSDMLVSGDRLFARGCGSYELKMVDISSANALQLDSIELDTQTASGDISAHNGIVIEDTLYFAGSSDMWSIDLTEEAPEPVQEFDGGTYYSSLSHIDGRFISQQLSGSVSNQTAKFVRGDFGASFGGVAFSELVPDSNAEGENLIWIPLENGNILEIYSDESNVEHLNIYTYQ